MLFNAPEFLLVFLPIVLSGYALLLRLRSGRAPFAWLVAASLFFYAWWRPAYLPLLLGSIGVNFLLGRRLGRPGGRSRPLLVVGIAFNLALLGVFKYAGFFVSNASALLNAGWEVPGILLPLAISFFTFQQIAFLVDTYRGEAREASLLDYALFVSFFPQLIAGPIVHHEEVLPQLRVRRRLTLESLSVGGTLFVIGLMKKVLIADGLAPCANASFDSAASGMALSLLEAWGGTLAYALQLYFDFSGYSDMAIGLGRIFGIRLPLNFDSPYKATNIIEFWRRWHMTLSRFLRDYLYIALGGNRKGRARRHANLMVTMLLGGLWHGAGWTFVLWGGLHGLYLVANHAWRSASVRLGWTGAGVPGKFASRALTFLCVLVAWVFFRAADLETALSILGAMAGANGVVLPAGLAPLLPALSDFGVIFGKPFYNSLVDWSAGVPLLLLALLAALFAPNSRELMTRFESSLASAGRRRLGMVHWRPHWAFGLAVGAGFFLAATRWFTAAPSEFLYFNF